MVALSTLIYRWIKDLETTQVALNSRDAIEGPGLDRVEVALRSAEAVLTDLRRVRDELEREEVDG